MPSRNERERWERAWGQMVERMERQKQALTRLVLVNTETVAALEEIVDGDDGPRTIAQARRRAQEALDRIGAAAAAAEESVEELEGEEVPDPRRRH